VVRTNGKTIATFTRAFDGTFSADGALDILLAQGDTDALAYHSVRGASKLTLSPAVAAAAAPTGVAAAAANAAGTRDNVAVGSGAAARAVVSMAVPVAMLLLVTALLT
jgi:hypothetical protein